MAKNLHLDFSTSRTYKTAEKLEAAIVKAQIPNDYSYFIMIVPFGKNSGRFTAVFTNTRSDNRQPLIPIKAGFMVVG